jgi:hypothetical protein
VERVFQMGMSENVILQFFIENGIAFATISFNKNSALKDVFSPSN